MSNRSLPLNPEAAAEPKDVVLRRLARALDYAEGFWLGFAKCNSPAQRREVVAECRALLEPLRIHLLEIELTEPVTDLLPVLRERVGGERNEIAQLSGPAGDDVTADKLAIFVYGLEHSIPSREAYPPLLSALNLSRELFRQQVPHPLVLWLPDYALTALARKAPDFWAWRSGLYEFPPERELIEGVFEVISGEARDITANLPEPVKRQRLVMLKGLLDDYSELGDGSREREARASILIEIGILHELLGEYTYCREAGEEALAIYRSLNNEAGVARALHLLFIYETHVGNYEKALRLGKDSLDTYRKLGHRKGEAAMLHLAGILANRMGEREEAKQLLSGSLEIEQEIGNQLGQAQTLHQLGILAEDAGEFVKARQLYNESLEIKKKFNSQHNVAITTAQLGRLAEKEGDLPEAARSYREALRMFEKLGSPYAEIARRDLERVEGVVL